MDESSSTTAVQITQDNTINNSKYYKAQIAFS